MSSRPIADAEDDVATQREKDAASQPHARTVEGSSSASRSSSATGHGATESAPDRAPPTDARDDDKCRLPALPSRNTCLSDAEITQLRYLLYEFRDRFNDG